MKQTQQLTAIIEREEDGYVTLCPELDIASQGDTVEEAQYNLIEALELFFETADPSEVMIISHHLTNHAQDRMIENSITWNVVIKIIEHPLLEEIDPEDGNKKSAFGLNSKPGGSPIRVVYNWTTNPRIIITVHPDRRYRGRI